MKTTLRRFLLLLIVLLCCGSSYGQSPVFWLTITDSSAIDHIDTIGANYIPTFADPAVQGTFSGGGMVSIEQAMPNADDLCLRWIWRVRGADSTFMNTLVTTYPALFPAYQLTTTPEPLAHTPNDWNLLGLGGVNYLDFIGARNAWDASLGGTKGDSTVIIGITDGYFDTTNVDIKANSVAIITGNQGGAHGTEVAGIAAGRTDNNTLLPSIGYRCRMNLSDDPDYYATMQHMIKDTTGGRVRVTNGSWGTDQIVPDGMKQVVCDEIYEAGATGVFAAGNGYKSGSGLTYTYYYPASYDFNISVSSIGIIADTGKVHLKDIHEVVNAGDSTLSHQHNDRVDICAPGWTFLLQSNNSTWQVTSGTSYASPVVAGTCALMYSQQSCLTPYQVEYLLKKTSKDIYQETLDGGAHHYNAHYYNGISRYTSRLGAGRLQADKAVFAASKDSFECNDPTTQTMYIDGVTLTHNCAPGTVPGLSNPAIKIGEIHNGKPGYTYLWTPLNGNNVILSSYTAASPQITGITIPGEIPVAYFRLAVYDASEIQKVATVRFRIQLIYDTVSDLAMRDSYYDMLDEPNSQFSVNSNNFDIWHSPDLWVRDTADGGLDPQDPQHFTTDSPNMVYIRVRNVGCRANKPDASALHLYWTLSSTGEKWDQDWKGGTLVPGNGLPGVPSFLPGGGEITTFATCPVVPSLQPGADTILEVRWKPYNPSDYAGSHGTPPHVDACILARLIETSRPDSGFYKSDSGITRTATNINNNNNIVTRNFAIVNLGKACAHCKITSSNDDNTHRVYVANAENHDQVFTVEMISQKDVKRYLSGDISRYCYVSLALGDLYDRWQEAGGHGSYMSKDAETKTVTYDPSSPLRLEGINLHAGEHFPVDVTFELRSGVTIPYAIHDFNLYIRQMIHEGKGAKVYGAVVYNLNIAATEAPEQRQSPPSGSASNRAEALSYYTVYPNPVSGMLSIRYTGAAKTVSEISITDITGKTVARRSGIAMQAGSVYQVKMSPLAPGTYFIHIEDTAGNAGTQKITKE